MASISTASTGGSENIVQTAISFSASPNDWNIAFVMTRYGILSMNNWTRFYDVSVNLLGTSGYATGFYFNNTTGFGSVSITSNYSGYLSYVILRIQPDQNKRLFLRATNGAVVSTNSPAIAVPGELSDQSVIIGGHCVFDDVYFVDTDTTDGSWSSVAVHTSSGVDRAVAAQGKIVTGSSPQIYSGTMSSSEVLGIMSVNLTEVEFGQWGMKS